jgi:hypothetical protein
MSIYNKIKWVLGILMVFVIIVATNLIDKDHFDKINGVVVTIYEDRLVAYDLIYDITNAIHEKELALRTQDSTFFERRNDVVNTAIENALASFSQTKLTDAEKMIFRNVKKDFTVMQEDEQGTTKMIFTNEEQLLADIAQFKQDLADLATIQVQEGKRQVSASNNTFALVELFTQIEIIILVALAIIIQLIILYKPKD